MSFRPAARRNARLRLALTGPAGSGKTWTMLEILTAFSERPAVLDSERGSSEKYARKGSTPIAPGNWAFDVAGLDELNPQAYVAKIHEAATAGYTALGLDSWSHSWIGALEMIDKMGGWTKGGKTVSPAVAKLVDAVLTYPGHVVATMRSKMEHAVEKDEKTGKTTVRKIGMAAVAREGTEYEFDVILDLGLDGVITVQKSRCPGLSGSIFTRPDVRAKIVPALKAWLDEGAPLTEAEQILERVRGAASAADLAAIAPSILAASGAGKIDAAELGAIRGAYTARKAQLVDEEVPA